MYASRWRLHRPRVLAACDGPHVAGPKGMTTRSSLSKSSPANRLLADLAAHALEVRETHISWVFLTEHRAFKVKKAVSLGFLDFHSPEQRRRACEAEVELNRRLSSDVYLGVVPITQDDKGRHRFGGEGKAMDWAVEMRRLSDRDRLDERLREGRLADSDLQRLAQRLAQFHERARCDEHTSRFGAVEVIERNVRENFAQTSELVDAFITQKEEAEIEESQLSFLRDHHDLFQARMDTKKVRDGHGDLRLEQIYADDEGNLQILDCIEFNERFRFADTCADIAFLTMDLVYAGRDDLAERLLALYARESADFDLYTLVDFYEGYRAYVRAKVTAMLAYDEGADPSVRDAAQARARRYFLLALASQRRPLLPPVLIAVGGPLASGKSTLADRLSAQTGVPVVSSDYTRKNMLGAQPTDKLYEGSWAGAYDPKFTDKVYDEVFRRAVTVLRSGRPVIVDASFRSVELRARAKQTAEREGVEFRFVHCHAPEAVCRERLRARDMRRSVSDGRLEIFEDFMAKWEPPAEVSAAELATVDTSGPVERSLEEILRRVPHWPLD